MLPPADCRKKERTDHGEEAEDDEEGDEEDHEEGFEEAGRGRAAARRVNIFVFGSNLAGRHGRGAALEARLRHGAVYGVGEGLSGRSYAIPTKDERLRTRPLPSIKQSVERFMKFAVEHPEMTFQVTRVGCGLAGYHDTDIAPMFAGAPTNCILPEGWR